MTMKVGEPLIVNLACTGAVPTKANSPHVPLSLAEIVDDIAPCLEAGVQMLHIHTRDSELKQNSDPEPYGRLIESVRALPGGQGGDHLCYHHRAQGRLACHPQSGAGS